MIKLYLSSIETEYKQIDRMFSRGYPTFGVQVSYVYLRKAQYLVEAIAKWNVDYNVRCYVTSGLEGANRKLSKSNEILEILDEIGEEKYSGEYVDWLLKNPASYEKAFEFNYDNINPELLAKLRQIYMDNGIAKHIIIFVKETEGIPFVKEMLSKGFLWFSLDNIPEEQMKQMIVEIDTLGGFVHLDSFQNYDILDIKENVESVSTSVWTQGSRSGKIYFLKFGRLKIYDATDPDALNACLQDRFWNILPDDVRKKIGTAKSMHYVNLWNAYQIQEYVHHLNDRIPAYKEYLKKGGALPEFSEGKDSIGRDKIKEIAKFKNPTNAIFSRKLLNFGLQCNTCIIRDKCIAYKKDSVCAYTKVWKDTGALNTRNTEAIVASLEDVVEEQNQRLIRAQFIETTQGGTIKKDVTDLQNSLIRNIDILYKLKFGTTNTNKYNILNVGSNQMVVGQVEDILQTVRKEMGESAYNTIKGKVETEEEEDGGNSE